MIVFKNSDLFEYFKNAQFVSLGMSKMYTIAMYEVTKSYNCYENILTMLDYRI